MKVKELIEKLQQMPQEARVAVYCEMSEDSDMAYRVEILTKEEGPYNKADDVWVIYNIPQDEPIVFVR